MAVLHFKVAMTIKRHYKVLAINEKKNDRIRLVCYVITFFVVNHVFIKLLRKHPIDISHIETIIEIKCFLNSQNEKGYVYYDL